MKSRIGFNSQPIALQKTKVDTLAKPELESLLTQPLVQGFTNCNLEFHFVFPEPTSRLSDCAVIAQQFHEEGGNDL